MSCEATPGIGQPYQRTNARRPAKDFSAIEEEHPASPASPVGFGEAPSVHPDWICPTCGNDLDVTVAELACNFCPARFPVENGIVDFLAGRYFDDFDPATPLSDVQRLGMRLEEEGAATRIENFYEPKLNRLRRMTGKKGRPLRVLDCGCGNGIGVERLNESGFDGWGTDASALRKHQWNQRRFRDRFFSANALALPVRTGFFDVVIASGVLEHIGVEERRDPHYRVRPLTNRDALRRRFLSEILRVTDREGRIWIDFPNGAFPIDFWHGERPGQPRWHSRAEGFLPSLAEVRSSIGALRDDTEVESLSPRRRLAFRQARLHFHGKALRFPARLLFLATAWGPFRFLSGTALNPYMVLEIRRKR